MDLKRVWRNGFLVSLIFALPLSDLYYYEHGNLIAGGNSRKPTQQAANCAAGTDCSGFQNGDSSASGNLNGENDADENGLLIPAETLISTFLESNGYESGNIREAALHFSTQDILQSVDLTDEDNPYLADDIKQIVDTDIGSVAVSPFGFGKTTSYAPGHSGPYAPVMSAGGGNAESASRFQSVLEDATETPFPDTLPESSTQAETSLSNDTIQSVPEPSSLVMMTIGTISVASLLHRRKSTSPVSRS